MSLKSQIQEPSFLVTVAEPLFHVILSEVLVTRHWPSRHALVDGDAGKEERGDTALTGAVGDALAAAEPVGPIDPVGAADTDDVDAAEGGALAPFDASRVPTVPTSATTSGTTIAVTTPKLVHRGRSDPSLSDSAVMPILQSLRLRHRDRTRQRKSPRQLDP